MSLLRREYLKEAFEEAVDEEVLEVVVVEAVTEGVAEMMGGVAEEEVTRARWRLVQEIGIAPRVET